VIYAAETYAGAPLEVLVHSNLSQPPKNHRAIHISDEIGIETVTPTQLPRWTTCSKPKLGATDGSNRSEPLS
jgi:hypothetical protein